MHINRQRLLTVINVCLVTALVVSLLPQFLPSIEVLTRYLVVVCTIAAVSAYVLCQDRSKDKQSSVRPETVSNEAAKAPVPLSELPAEVHNWLIATPLDKEVINNASARLLFAHELAHELQHADISNFSTLLDYMPTQNSYRLPTIRAELTKLAPHEGAAIARIVLALIREGHMERNPRVNFGRLALEIATDEAKVHVGLSKNVHSKVPRSLSPFYAGIRPQFH